MITEWTVLLQQFPRKGRMAMAGGCLDVMPGSDIVVVMKGRRVLLLMVLMLVAAAGCRALDGGGRPGDVALELDVPFTLENGQRAALRGGDLEITFDSVVRDGRCPSEVNCAEHGAVEILVVVEQGAEAGGGEGASRQSSYEMNPDPALAQFSWAPTRVTFGEYTIEVQSVEPYPRRPEDLEAFDEYEATLVVSESGGE